MCSSIHVPVNNLLMINYQPNILGWRESSGCQPVNQSQIAWRTTRHLSKRSKKNNKKKYSGLCHSVGPINHRVPDESWNTLRDMSAHIRTWNPTHHLEFVLQLNWLNASCGKCSFLSAADRLFCHQPGSNSLLLSFGFKLKIFRWGFNKAENMVFLC